VSDLEIRPSAYDAPEAEPLLRAAHEDLIEVYGSGDENPVDPREFDPPAGRFLIAWLDGEAIACGAWRTVPDGKAGAVDGDTAEIKRMFAAPAARGSGVAAALLRALEDSAREHGRRRMVLETGTPQAAAVRFYEKNGYRPIENYGFYREYDDCRSFARDL
jgi:GNAT superfamily N-acetyltransferase